MKVISFDIGTSKIKAGLYTEEGEKVGESIRDSEIIFPGSGLAEQDPHLWLKNMEEMSRKFMDKDVKGLGITGQMIGLVPVDRNLEPLSNAIIWLDSRASREAEEILERIPLMDFLEITGGIPSGKDVVAKILWLKNNRREIFERTAYFLDVKDFLISRITGNVYTDISTASVRGLVDKNKREYSTEILDVIGITADRLPEIMDASEIAGTGRGKFSGLEVVNGSGDAFITPFGAGAVRDGSVHYYLGTSAWASTHTQDYLINEERGIGSVPSVIPGKWLFISESETAGTCLDWFMDNLSPGTDYDTIEKHAKESPPGSRGIIFLPWLYGERSPILDVYARGGFINLSLSHNFRDVYRSIFEGVAMNARWMISGLMDSGISIEVINAVGGGAKSDLWMQILSDVTGLRINRIEDPQNATLRGIALLSLLSLGRIGSHIETEKYVRVNRQFEPREDTREIYDALFENFRGSYEALKGIFESLNYGRGE
ncbi:MAG: xylulokinase [Thermoplasmata archaeon]